MWIIVNFTEENSVEVVPENWLADNNHCYWPSYRGSKLKSAIAEQIEAGNDWCLHPIRVINKNKLYDDLIKARNACDKAQFTSDCSENEHKRIIRKKVSSSGSSESSDEGFQRRLPEVPEGLIKNKQSRNLPIMKSPVGNKETLVKSSCSNSQQLPSYNKQLQSSRHISQQHTSQEQDPLEQSSQSFNNTSREFEFQVLRKLTTLSLKIQQIAEDVTDIRTKLSEKNEDCNNLVDDELILYQFPIDSPESFENFERCLRDEEKYKKFVVYLVKIGGNTEYECVKRIYSRILTSEIACEYNWHGLKKKKPLRDSILAKGTIDAIMKNENLRTSEKNIELAIKSWLRHARERLVKKAAPQGDEENIPI